MTGAEYAYQIDDDDYEVEFPRKRFSFLGLL